MTQFQYTPQKIALITNGKLIPGNDDDQIVHDLLTDSRQLVNPEDTMFIALTSERNDGHRFIPELVKRGVRCFMVSKQVPPSPLKGDLGVTYIIVPDTLAALQKLAAYHRNQFDYPVIGITGSNGKTIVKEWLYQLLSPDFKVIRSPKSYNSQVGVPLSVWNMDSNHNLGIIEAGISLPGEMEKLEEIIYPAIGIFTNIGPAHDEFFTDETEKIREKLKLFRNSDTLIYRSDYKAITTQLQASTEYANLNTFTWGTNEDDNLRILEINKGEEATLIRVQTANGPDEISIPFRDDASIENAIHCWAIIQFTSHQSPVTEIYQRFTKLVPVAMRLEMKEAINSCSLINDSYNSDINSLRIALDFLKHQVQHRKRTLLLSDILQTGREPEEFYDEVSRIVTSSQIDRIIGIGPELSKYQEKFPMQRVFYKTTDDFFAQFPISSFREETILVKGARIFEFERIIQALQQKAHETVLEINLNALVHNLNYFRAKFGTGVKTMAMVKAFSYGSGSFEIANLMQYHHVDYLAVAYADEGVELRKANISLPIMVMSPEEQSLDSMLAWNLEPEIYSLHILSMLEDAIERNYASTQGMIRIHIKLDTGMHRLGFCADELDTLLERVNRNPKLQIRSVFSHLAASEDETQDAFTREQFTRFHEMSEHIIKEVDYPILRHILNTAGISRFPEEQMDMVRLGIGLYGVGYNDEEQNQLRNVNTLRSVVTQVKQVKKGDTIGYERRGIAEKDSVVAVVPVGYADGLNRKLGNGKGLMIVKGIPAPIIGDVCMDLCMLDVTGVVEAGKEVKEGDRVIVFGDRLSVSTLAKKLGTIPYEILTGISRRVKRIYFFE